jgi:hypothetical protein
LPGEAAGATTSVAMKGFLSGISPGSKRIIQILSAFNYRFLGPASR